MSLPKVLVTTRVVVQTKTVFIGGKLHVVTDSVRVVIDAALAKAAARSEKELVLLHVGLDLRNDYVTYVDVATGWAPPPAPCVFLFSFSLARSQP